MPHHRRSSPPILSPPVLIILLPIITFLFLLFAVPPFLSFTSHIFRPIAVKRSWDLLNIFLVLFAILCGIFAKRNDDESANNDVDSNVVPNLNGSGGGEPEPVNPQRWFGFSEDRRSEKIYGDVGRTAESGGLQQLRRSSSSYPDLRQESLWERSNDQRFQFRFFDDFEINKYSATAPYDPSREAGARPREAGDGEAKEIPVDTFVLRPTTPPKSPSPFPSPSPCPSPSPATPPPPLPVDRHKPRRMYQAAGDRKEKSEKKHEDSNDVEIDQFAKVRSLPQTPPPPPPRPPPSPARILPEQKYVKLERRKSNVKKEIAMALTSLYSQRKRKKKQKIDRDSATSSPPEQIRFPPPSPPPPPPPLPPPPSFVFHSLFKKGSKNKQIHTVPPPPPTPPPPPISSSPPTLSRSSKHKNRSMPPPAPSTPPPFSSSLRLSKHKNRSAPPPPPPPQAAPTPPPPPATERSRSGGRPPLSGRSVNYYEENVNSGSQNPLIPMPPPPPPPPFKMSEFKFVVRGDYVRIRSSQSSRSSSPELDDIDASSTKVEPEIVNVMDGGDGPVAGSASCPSPDVNIKADTFIARLHDGWRLEKINSLREKWKM